MAEPPAGGAPVVARAAPAKINLYLHVTGRRADGFHELDSLVAFAGVADEVAARPARDLALTVAGANAAEVPAGADNLVVKAALALKRAAGVTAGAAITLAKRLPVAAGIGGGSADAAATLRALAALWRIPADEGILARLAAGLGADVPVCLYGRAAFVGGVGEDVRAAPALPPAWLVLANPGVPLPTAAVFAARRGPFSAPARFAGAAADARALAALLAARRNDLTAAAETLVPAIGDCLAALAAAPGALVARMSGSGATCFALFAGADQAAPAAAALARARPAWWVRAAPLLGDVRALAPGEA